MTPERGPESLRNDSGAALPRARARVRGAGNREQGREQGAGKVVNSPSTPTSATSTRELDDGGWMAGDVVQLDTGETFGLMAADVLNPWVLLSHEPDDNEEAFIETEYVEEHQPLLLVRGGARTVDDDARDLRPVVSSAARLPVGVLRVDGMRDQFDLPMPAGFPASGLQRATEQQRNLAKYEAEHEHDAYPACTGCRRSGEAHRKGCPNAAKSMGDR